MKYFGFTVQECFSMRPRSFNKKKELVEAVTAGDKLLNKPCIAIKKLSLKKKSYEESGCKNFRFRSEYLA
jgi:hypothetical protein